MARRVVPGRLAPAIRPHRSASWLDAGEAAESGDELAIREWRGRLADDLPVAARRVVAMLKLPCQALVNRAWAKDQEVVAGWQPVGYLRDELPHVFEAVPLTGVLGAPAAAVADVTGGPVVRRNGRLDALDAGRTLQKPNDHRLLRVDPDEGAGSRLSRAEPGGRPLRRHERAQTGPASTSSARSA